MSDRTRTSFPSERAWAKAAADGERSMKQTLIFLSGRILSRKGANALIHAAAIGCLVELGRYIAAMANPAGCHIAEQYAMAHLRGALRGASGPINDNGTSWERATDA
nr:hypothetical protein [uncultured Rhodopila sp.]